MRVRALRAWRTPDQRYFARVVVLTHAGDTMKGEYLLIEDGVATYASRLCAPNGAVYATVVANPQGAAIVYRPEGLPVNGWVGWSGQLLESPGHLRLLLQVPDWPPHEPIVF
jgi:hypothetical protein